MPSEFERETLDGMERERKMKRDLNDLSGQLGLSRPPIIPVGVSRLGIGAYGDGVLSAESHILGSGQGTKLGTLTIDANVHIQDVELRRVVVNSGKAIFSGCSFRLPAGDKKVPASTNYCFQSAAAQIVFLGCTFHSGITSSFVVSNVATLNDLFFIGCSNLTGLTLSVAHTTYGTI